MAAQLPENGRESLSLSLGGKRLGIQTANLTTILLLLGGIAGGVLLWLATDRRLQTLETQHTAVMDALQATTATLLDAAHEHRTFVLEKLLENRERQEQQTNTLARMLHTLQYNLGQEPQHQLPLGLTPADTPPQRRLGP